MSTERLCLGHIFRSETTFEKQTTENACGEAIRSASVEAIAVALAIAIAVGWGAQELCEVVDNPMGPRGGAWWC